MLQEARIFNDSHVDARRCQQVRIALESRMASKTYSPAIRSTLYFLGPAKTLLCTLQVITKLLYLLCQGETFTKVCSCFNPLPLGICCPSQALEHACLAIWVSRMTSYCRPAERSYRGILQRHKAFSGKGCQPETHGLFGHQGGRSCIFKISEAWKFIIFWITGSAVLESVWLGKYFSMSLAPSALDFFLHTGGAWVG